MITGDNKLTAVAIARNCRILEMENDIEDSVLLGIEFMEKIGGVICKKCETHQCPCPRNEKEKKKMIQNYKKGKNKNKEENVYSLNGTPSKGS